MIFELMWKIYKSAFVFTGLNPSRSFASFVRAANICLKNINIPITKTFNAFDKTFYNFNNMASQSPSIKAGGGVKLWQYLPLSGSKGAFIRAASPLDYADIPTNWK